MKRLAGAAIALTMLLLALTVVYDRRLRSADPVGHRNMAACLRIPRGSGEGELRAALGEPTRRAATAGGWRLEFATLRVAAAPIRADVDGASGRVTALWCRDEPEPTWRVP